MQSHAAPTQKSVRFELYIPHDTFRQLEEAKATSGNSIASIVRDAIQEKLQTQSSAPSLRSLLHTNAPRNYKSSREIDSLIRSEREELA